MKDFFVILVITTLLFSGCGTGSSEPKTIEQSTTQDQSKASSNSKSTAPNENEDSPPCWETSEQYPASKFAEGLSNLKDFKYKYEVKRLEEVGKNQTLLNKGLNFINSIRRKRKEPIVDTLTMNGIVTMRQAMVKGTLPLGGNTYPRVEIEEWEFKSEACVEEALGTIARIRLLIPWDRISKSPLEYWHKGNKLYFLVPGGFNMINEGKFIQSYLQKNI